MLTRYLYYTQRILIALHKETDQHPEPFVDHAGISRNSKTGRPIHGVLKDREDGEDDGVDDMRGFLVGCDINEYGMDNQRDTRSLIAMTWNCWEGEGRGRQITKLVSIHLPVFFLRRSFLYLLKNIVTGL